MERLGGFGVAGLLIASAACGGAPQEAATYPTSLEVTVNSWGAEIYSQPSAELPVVPASIKRIVPAAKLLAICYVPASEVGNRGGADWVKVANLETKEGIGFAKTHNDERAITALTFTVTAQTLERRLPKCVKGLYSPDDKKAWRR